VGKWVWVISMSVCAYILLGAYSTVMASSSCIGEVFIFSSSELGALNTRWIEPLFLVLLATMGENWTGIAYRGRGIGDPPPVALALLPLLLPVSPAFGDEQYVGVVIPSIFEPHNNFIDKMELAKK
jgi:hypothetical protein